MSSAVEILDQAKACHRAGELCQAEALYRQVVDRDPRHVEAQLLLGVACLAANKLDDALGCFRAALAVEPDNPECYRQLTAAEFERQGVVETPAYAEYRSRNSQSSGGASTQLQKYLQWMQQAGFSNVDCVWKHFSRAVVYGERPVET